MSEVVKTEKKKKKKLLKDLCAINTSKKACCKELTGCSLKDETVT